MTDTLPASAANDPASDDGEMYGYGEFLDAMQELGLLHDLEDELPDGFSAVFEIGRILRDPKSEMAQALASALRMEEPRDVEERSQGPSQDEHLVEVPAGEEYEAEFIRHWSDVRYIYSWQHLLPEEEFLRRLAKRRLWFPMAKSPVIHGIAAGEEDFDPIPSKQKVYVLLDTSASMALRHRFAFAKAVVLRFLRENRREAGQVSLRTFDVSVGPLQTAASRTEYDALLRRIARQHLLGNGTCLERAILQACDDIYEQRALSGAEILVVTDGAAHLDEARVRDALGDRVRLHCVKIGGAQVFATDVYIEEALDFRTGDSTPREQHILSLRERKQKLESQLKYSHDETTRQIIRAAMAKCDRERQDIAGELKDDYGHEIERLADVFVEVPDLDAAQVLRVGARELEQLRHLVRSVCEDLDERPTMPETLKQAALLLTHLTLLESEQTDAEMVKHLEELRRSVESRLEGALADDQERVLDSGLLSQTDQRDLRILLRRGTGRYSSLWLTLLRYFYKAVGRWVRRG